MQRSLANEEVFLVAILHGGNRMYSNCVTFLKPDGEFGGLLNRSGEYPIAKNGVRVLTSEHICQAPKLPNPPEIRKEVLSKPSQIEYKWTANKKEYRSLDDTQCRHHLKYWTYGSAITCLSNMIDQNLEV